MFSLPLIAISYFSLHHTPRVVENHVDVGKILAYKLRPGETLKYRLQADIVASMPLLDSKEPVDLTATVKMIYLATPKTLLKDGSSDIDFTIEPGSAEIEVAKIPFPVTDDQAKEILNQSVTMTRFGEVKGNTTLKPLPFVDSIPGVDPRRLFALMFPVVFPGKQIAPGSSWTFKSELLGSSVSVPKFTAIYLPLGSEKVIDFKNKKPRVVLSQNTTNNLTTVFEMAINQQLNSDKKTAKPDEAVYKHRIGNIKGSGEFNMDVAAGHIVSGMVKISALLTDTLVGKPLTDDEPKELVSKVEATIKVTLEPFKRSTKTPTTP